MGQSDAATQYTAGQSDTAAASPMGQPAASLMPPPSQVSFLFGVNCQFLDSQLSPPLRNVKYSIGPTESQVLRSDPQHLKEAELHEFFYEENEDFFSFSFHLHKFPVSQPFLSQNPSGSHFPNQISLVSQFPT